MIEYLNRFEDTLYENPHIWSLKNNRLHHQHIKLNLNPNYGTLLYQDLWHPHPFLAYFEKIRKYDWLITVIWWQHPFQLLEDICLIQVPAMFCEDRLQHVLEISCHVAMVFFFHPISTTSSESMSGFQFPLHNKHVKYFTLCGKGVPYYKITMVSFTWWCKTFSHKFV